MVRSVPDYQRLADLSPDAVFRWDFARGLTFVSTGFERMTGHAAGDVLLRPEFLPTLFHATGWADFQSAVARVRDDGADSATVVAQLRTRDGKPVWVEAFAIPVRDERGRVVGVDGSARDVSQHLSVADQLSRRTMEQATLLQVQRELLTQLDLRRTLGKIVDRAQRLLRATTCTVFMLEPDGASLRPLASAGEYAQQLMSQRPQLGQGLTGWVAEHGVPQKVDHTARDVRVSLVPDTPDEDESLMCAPLELGGRVTGALLLSGRPEQYAESDLDFLVALAQVAALAIANSQTFDQIQRQAMTDSLTGAFNRAFFTQNLRAELNRAQRLGYSVGLLMVDVDDLKRVNDRHGHLAGDELLRMVVEGLRMATRETDWVARYGGDEFAVVLPGCAPDQLEALGEKLRRNVAERNIGLPDGRRLGITISLGGSVFPGMAATLEDLIEQADQCELQAKAARGDRVVIHMGAAPIGRG
ncbi:MAG TPA: diguanylate cyclase [Anaerolineales bacterium]|nr:diguanylate cyclase [Anaerolineales bacterium]